MLILNKSFESIQKKAEEKLNEMNVNMTPGSIARLFTSIINSEQAEFYDTLTVYHAQCFISTATGTFLELIGKLLNCYREPLENDENYRYRITKQTLILSNANETAIRLAALSVDEVNDVHINKFSNGIGSFSVYILNNNTVAEELLINVFKKIDKTVGCGIKFNVLIPRSNYISLKIKLIFKNTVSISLTDEIKAKIKADVNNYIISLKIGEAFILNELTQIVMQQNDNILNYSITEFKINDKNAMYTNQYCKNTEKFAIKNKQYSVIID